MQNQHQILGSLQGHDVINRDFSFLCALPQFWAQGNDNPGLQVVSAVQPSGCGVYECRIRHSKYVFLLFLFSVYCVALWGLLREGAIKYKLLVKNI